GIRGGLFPLVPGENVQGGFANCTYCDYDRICPIRRDLLTERKSGDPGAGIHRLLALPGGGGTGDD
ncbi:MAG TPA: hypothetical protein VFZ25_01430, partial [Chloroflexota bacterium]|nr:hypothetical protein [Chloroflexota bacterium]